MVHSVLGFLDERFERLAHGRARDGALAALLLTPAALVLAVFGFFPLFYSLYMSLFDTLRGAGPFVGLGNYATALKDETFWNSVLVTVYYVVGTVPITLVLSFAVASGLFNLVRGRGFFRTVYFLPYITSVVAAAMIWRTLLNPAFGTANALLTAVGLPAQQWLLEPRGVLCVISGGVIPPTVGPSLALCCVILFEIWHAMGFMIVVFLAGLSAIPRELEEAARIDGAGAWRTARHVTLPLLSPTVFFLTVVSVIRAFQAFNGFYALTGDGRGPLDTTQNLTVLIFASFYQNGQWGYGAAVAVLMWCAIMALTLLQWRLGGRRVHYG